MQCALYDAGRCRSCQWITQPIPEQLSAKTVDLKNLLADFPVEEWCAPVSGPEQGFRNKAKMVVSGSVEKPLLGMLHRDGTPEDLCDCPLYPASFAPVFAALNDAPRDKCTLSCAINGIHAAFHYLKKNYISGCVMTVPTG